MLNLIKKTIKKILNANKLPCYIISRKPFISICYWHDFQVNEKDIKKAVSQTETPYFLFQLGWHRENVQRMELLKEELKILDGSKINYFFLVNSRAEKQLFDNYGIPNSFCHQNAFLDENNYSIINRKKLYDAIYIARITPFKRHYLASDITSLKLIGNFFDREKEHYLETMEKLRNAYWNRKVSAKNIPRHIAMAKTGLCLSAEEGAMFVSAEYLLCGCPVVSTENLGGRHELFGKDFTVIVDDSPEAVKEGVTSLIASSPAPENIRTTTIELMTQHRQRFIELVQGIYDSKGVQRNFTEEWQDVFVHKFGLRCSNWHIAANRFLKKEDN